MAGASMGQSMEQEKEPMLLLDTTGSMNYATAENEPTPRRDTIREAISVIVGELAKEDSQSAKEEGGGGLRTVTFAGGTAHDLEDLNPSNLQQKWGNIRWGGGTEIMPGLRKLIAVYNDEFGSRPADDRPLLMAVIITDGEAEDTADFANAVAQAKGGVYFVLGIIGYGAEHDAALSRYQSVAQQNPHVKVISFNSQTDPQVIAKTLLQEIA